jgi:hypothetical protein
MQNGDVGLMSSFAVMEDSSGGKILCQVYPSNGVLLGRYMVSDREVARVMEGALKKIVLGEGQ